MKRKALIFSVLLILFILVGAISYFLGTKSSSPSVKNKESIKTGTTPTATLEPAVAATESSQISPITTVNPSTTLTPTATSTVTPAKTLIIPPYNLRKLPTATLTPTPKPTLQQIQGTKKISF
jgi:hypothetical protein